MSWYRNTSVSAPLLLGLALSVLLAPALPVAAQNEPLEKRYQRAVDYFNSAKVEDACELFRSIEKEEDDYKQTKMYVKQACHEAQRIRKLEGQLFQEGVDFFKQGKYEEAEGKFNYAKQLPLKNPKRRDQINDYLARIEARRRREKLFTEAVNLFNQGRDTEARKRFQEIVEAGGPQSDEARQYLDRIQKRREESAFQEGVQAFNNKNFSTARGRFREVVDLDGKHKAGAQQYLSQIDQLQREQRLFDQAVQAFDQGRFQEAKTTFQQVVALGGRKQREARQYLNRIDTENKAEAVFQSGLQKFRREDFNGAKADFQRVVQLGGRRENEARNYLTRIAAQGRDPRKVADELLAEAQSAFQQKNYAGAVEKLQAVLALVPNHGQARQLLAQARRQAQEAPLRTGLAAYFRGKYADAERYLSNYLEAGGEKRSLAYFFRGAARYTRYLLSGDANNEGKQLALQDFRALKELPGDFTPPEDYVSPKILALYTGSEAAEGR